MVAAACGGDGASGSSAVASPTDEAVARFGHPLAPDADVVLQPEVTVVGGGPSVVLAVSADGLTWTIDGGASGAADLEAGRVMFVSSGAVGRVVDVQDAGGARVVTLVPVTFTEVVRDASIDLDLPIDPGDLVVQRVPDLPGAVRDPEERSGSDEQQLSAGRPGGLPTVLLASAPSPEAAQDGEEWSTGSTLPPPVRQSEATVEVGDWSVVPTVTDGQWGLGVRYTGVKGLEAGASVSLLGEGLRLRSSLDVVAGRIGSPTVVLDGITGLEVKFAAGAPNGADDNTQVVVEVPASFDIPIPPSPASAGLPLTLKIAFKFTVTTALSGKNTTLNGAGLYALDGPIGIEAGSMVSPSFSVTRSLMDSLEGLAIGPSGFVYAAKVAVTLGVGTPLVNAGPMVSFTTSVGVMFGSALGDPIAACRRGTLKVDVGGGVSLSVAQGVLDRIKARFPKLQKIEGEHERSHTVVNRTQAIPDVGACAA
jgi:hypothetical protein